MSIPDDTRTKVINAYNAAADTYDHVANSFWHRFGNITTERIGLKPGDYVLDICCGTGASAIPAAQLVGPKGRVIGVDLSENLLNLARAKAAKAGLTNLDFRLGDMVDVGTMGQQFDAVVCVFGIFFAADMSAAVKTLWQVVRQGGTLAITTWGPRFFEPASTEFWNLIARVRPDLHKGFNPWDRISTPESVLALLQNSGIEDADVVARSSEHLIPSPDAWWAALLGSGYRGTVDQLNDADKEFVRAESRKYILDSGITSVEANVVYALAHKRV